MLLSLLLDLVFRSPMGFAGVLTVKSIMTSRVCAC